MVLTRSAAQNGCTPSSINAKLVHKLLLGVLFSSLLLAGCAPVDRVSIGFGHDVNTVPEIPSKGSRKGLGEFVEKASFVNPIIRFSSLTKNEKVNIHPIAEFEVTDERSNFAAAGGELVYSVFENGEISVLGSTGLYSSEWTTGGTENIIENISFGFQVGYAHQLDDKIWLGLHYNHLSDAEIGEFNNATRDGFMLTIGYGF